MGRTPAMIEVTVTDGLLHLPDGRVASSPMLARYEGQVVRVAARGAYQRLCVPAEGRAFIVWMSPMSALELAAERKAEVQRDAKKRLRGAIGTPRLRAAKV